MAAMRRRGHVAVIVEGRQAASLGIQDIRRVRREVGGIVPQRGVWLAKRRGRLVGALPRSGLRREREERPRFLFPSHHGAAKDRATNGEPVEVAADLNAGFIQPPGLKHVRNSTTTCGDRAGLE